MQLIIAKSEEAIHGLTEKDAKTQTVMVGVLIMTKTQ